MKMLFCDVCNRKITIGEAESFNYNREGEGPFCDVCFFFVEKIQMLEIRIDDLEYANRIPLM
jgi:CRISPR/Cas system-associated protein Cas10 (large subunit of type III CRISPR-Cas system)